jgi:type IV fimbrial biogenesis protein FimT
MVAITILSIMLFIALPNFAVWMQNTQIRTAGEAVLSGMQLARAEAIRRNTAVQLHMNASSGWTARVMGTGEVIQSRLAGEGSAAALVTIEPADATKITFNGFGSLMTPNPDDGTPSIAVIKIDSPSIAAADSRDLCIVVGTGGTIRLCDPHVAVTDTRSCGSPLPAGCGP